jgi:protein-S-isoprenylcysteine O-methyltransferase Ste14
MEVAMKKPVFIVLGVVLVLAGVLWTLQGLNVMGQSGGMNGHKIFAVIGVIVGIVGIALLVSGVRTRRNTPAS